MAEEQLDLRSRMWKTAGRVFLKSIFAGVLALIVYFSMTMIFSGLGTKNIGEHIYEYDENSQPVLVDTIYYDEESADSAESETTSDVTSDVASTEGAESTESAESEDDGRFSVAIRSEMSPTADFFYQLLSIVCMVLLLLCMPYSDLWTLGDKDNNSVTFGRMTEDKFHGFKIGLIAGIPGFICFFLLVLSEMGVFADRYLALYQFLNVPYILVIQLITGGASAASEMATWCLIPLGLLTLLVPAVCGLGYYLGYKEFSLSEKFMYKSGKKDPRRR